MFLLLYLILKVKYTRINKNLLKEKPKNTKLFTLKYRAGTARINTCRDSRL